MQQYEHPDVLVETEWLEKNLKDANIKVVEIDYDRISNYDIGHIPGAVLIDWKKDLNDPVTRDIPDKEQLENTLNISGIANDSTIVLYGDFNNWFATFAFWIFKYYGIEKVKLLNGGRKKWLLENRAQTKDIPNYPKTDFKTSQPDETIRVYMDYVRQAIKMKDKILVDVRSPKEYSGEVLAPPEYPSEQAQRGGHIPGAKNIPWSQAVNDKDGTFKSRKELEELYSPKGVTPEKEVITYCRIGERSSHSWFVLKYLLGYLNVKNYDGSWSEWGNSVKAPVEK